LDQIAELQRQLKELENDKNSSSGELLIKIKGLET
jgi:hypothetical protein